MNDRQKILKTKNDLRILAILLSMYFILFVIIAIAILMDKNNLDNTIYYWALTIILIFIILDGFFIYKTYKTYTNETLLKQKAIKKYDERTRHLASQANAVTLISIVTLLPFVMIYALHINSIQLFIYSLSSLFVVILIRLAVSLFYKFKK